MGNHHSKTSTKSTESTKRTESTSYDTYRVAFVGPHDCGKTSVCIRFQGRVDYNIDYVITTLGAAYGTRLVYLDETVIRLEMWDTAGNERYIGLLSVYVRNASGIVAVYDVTDRYDFDRVSHWIEKARKGAPPDTTVMVLANRCDLVAHREVSYEDGRSLADGNDFLFFEVSAKDMTNIELALMTFVARMKEKRNNRSKSSD